MDPRELPFDELRCKSVMSLSDPSAGSRTVVYRESVDSEEFFWTVEFDHPGGGVRRFSQHRDEGSAISDAICNLTN